MIWEHIDSAGRRFGSLALVLDVVGFGLIFTLLVARDMGQSLHSHRALLCEQACIFIIVAAIVIGLVGLFADKKRGMALGSVAAPITLLFLFTISY